MSSMLETTRGFSGQLLFEPHVEHADKLPQLKKFLVVGMGGSGLAAELLRAWNPRLHITVHQDYGLPQSFSDEDLADTLIIASSYSGNTEEVLSGFDEALRRGLHVAVIAVGGALLERAKSQKVPYVQLPETHIQPRSARGFSFMAFLKLMGQEQALRDARKLAGELPIDTCENIGKELADILGKKVPVVYSSSINRSIAYNWKVVFNETGKIPAFYNIFPELNHNEMAGYEEKEVAEKFAFLFLKDATDHPRIQKRMEILEKLFTQKGFVVKIIDISESDVLKKLFSSLVVADFAAYYIAQAHGADPEHVRFIEEFKSMM